MAVSVKGANEQVVTSRDEVRRRWREYFEGSLNVFNSLLDLRCLGRGGRQSESWQGVW